MQAFREFKALWDPDWKMNPGKVVEPYRMDENLRLGANYKPWQPQTHFQFPEDHGSLAARHLALRRSGEVPPHQGGVMCPSFRVTREEEHSTRGRAHLLWEMTQGEVIRDGWHDERVKESLDLCLACKGCKSDCPVGVDVATYKAEFLSHYYEGRLRPPSQFVFGNIDLLGAPRFARARFGQHHNPAPNPQRDFKTPRRNPARARNTRLRSSNFQIMVCTPQTQEYRPCSRSSFGPTPLTIIFCPTPPRPPLKCSKPSDSTS